MTMSPILLNFSKEYQKRIFYVFKHLLPIEIYKYSVREWRRTKHANRQEISFFNRNAAVIYKEDTQKEFNCSRNHLITGMLPAEMEILGNQTKTVVYSEIITHEYNYKTLLRKKNTQ